MSPAFRVLTIGASVTETVECIKTLTVASMPAKRFVVEQ